MATSADDTPRDPLAARIATFHARAEACRDTPSLDAFWSLANDLLATLDATRPSGDEALDVRPEIVQWFHDSEEICEHDYDPPPCEIMADALLESFTVEARLYENKDGTFRFQREHFGRLHRAALATPASSPDHEEEQA